MSLLAGNQVLKHMSFGEGHFTFEQSQEVSSDLSPPLGIPKALAPTSFSMLTLVHFPEELMGN